MHKFSAYRKDGTLAWTAPIKKNEIESYTIDYCARGFWVEVSEIETKTKTETDDEKDTRLGERIISVLNLKKKENGRVDTTGGDKFPMGLARTMARILADEYEKGLTY